MWGMLLLHGLNTMAEKSLPEITMGFYWPVIREVPRQDVEISLRFWLDELARSGDLSMRPVQFYDDLNTMKRDADADIIQFMVASSMGFAQKFSPKDLADGTSGFKSRPDELLMVVRREARIRTIGDFAGKRIALLSEDELTDVYFETLLMKTWGKADWSRLGPVVRDSRSSKLVHRLFFNATDAAFLYRSAYDMAVLLNPQIGQRLQVLDEYSFKTRSPYTALFSSRTPLDTREHFNTVALKLSETPRGRQVLQIYQTDTMDRTYVSDLKPYWDLLTVHRTLKTVTASADKKKR